MKRVIFHIDVNSAFLSWEAVYRMRHLGEETDLREQVAAVGGDLAMRHGIILAKSIPAKRYHIRTGESILEARQKCPDLLLVPPNYRLYEKCSRAFMEILRTYAPAVEPYSVDEAFVDMTGTEGLWGSPGAAADRIRNQIREELGFTVNVGISENKLLAKMAGDFQKPDRVHTLWKEEIPEKMWPLPVSDLFFVGRSSERKLALLGIRTIGELAAADPRLLKAHLKKHGERIWEFANGMDSSAVEPLLPPGKGYGNSVTLPFDVEDAQAAKRVLLSLSETVGGRLREAGGRAQVLSVGIRDFALRDASHQAALPAATNITTELYRCASRLFDQLWDGTPIRKLGIHTGHIRYDAAVRQQSLFDGTDYQKLERMDAAADRIRSRYGKCSLVRAALLEPPRAKKD